VGIGASAGGLKAFSGLLANLPVSTGMAFVFVQHLDPTHGSALGEILSRTTKMAVTEIVDGDVVEPNHVYVIPANADLVISKGLLRLFARTVARGQHRPIDTFLRSLAEDRGDQAIAVILSGTATDGLEDITRETIETNLLHEREVQDADGAWYLMRARPYKTSDNRIDGAVVTFQDIDDLKRSLDETRLYVDTLIENARESIVVLDAKYRVLMANPAFYNSFQVSRQETEKRLIYDLGNRQWDIPRLRQLLATITTDTARMDDFEVRHKFQHLGERIMLLNARRVEPREGEHLIFLSIEDVTDRRSQLESLERQAALLDLAHDTVMVREFGGKIQFWNHGAEEMYGWKKEQALGKITHELLQTQFPQPLKDIEEKIRRVGYWQGELAHKHLDGRQLTVSSRWALLQQPGAPPVILEINSDITQRKQSEESLRQLSAYLMRLQDEERRRIARDLHDSIGQKLAAAKLQLETLGKSANLTVREKSLPEAVQWIDEAFQEVRTISQLLHPPLLDEAGLISATRWLVDGFSARSKIHVELQVADGVGRLSQPVELALFRVVQEALTNIHRHSGAKDAHIKLARSDGIASLEIRDSGKGMSPELLSAQAQGKQIVGVGILGMRERLSQLGGSLEIESSKSGTTVRASVPVTTETR
jgi:PAS domain S-box-containing protein